jgi:integrase
MSGNIRELKNGKWLVRVESGRDSVTGRRVQKSKTIAGSKRDARKILHGLQLEVSQNPISSSKITLNELFDMWIGSTTKGGKIRAETSVYNTRHRYDRYVRNSIGLRRLCDLKRGDVCNLYDQLLVQKLSPRTVGHVHSELRAVLNWAWRREYVIENVALRAEVPSIPLREIVAPEREVVQSHLTILEQTNPGLALALMLSATLGLRRSELAGLRWKHIDLERRVLHLREGITNVPGVGFTTTNTKTGVHGHADFELHELHVERLRLHRMVLLQRAGQSNMKLSDDAYVFSAHPFHATPIRPDSLGQMLRRHCQVHPHLPYITLKMLRNYTSSEVYGTGADETTAAAILRDSPETTARHYRAANRSRMRDATNVIVENLLLKNS